MNTTILHRSGLRMNLRSALVLGALIAIVGDVAAKPGNGKGRGNSPDFVPPGLVDKSVPPGHRRAPVEVVVLKAPPPLRIEVVPARPSAKHVWVAGYWFWESNAYVWRPGAWMAPPEPAAVWVTPTFERRNGVSVYISGYWKL